MKVAMVTTILPETHYSRYLVDAFQAGLKKDVEMMLYVDKTEDNLKAPQKNIKLVWSKNSIFYPFQILSKVMKDNVEIVHLQHEMNMYGGPITALIFPLLLLFLRMANKKVIITVHAVVPKEQIDSDFLRTFSWNPNYYAVLFIKLIFVYLYKTIGMLSTAIIVHSNYMKSVLIRDYGVSKDKIYSIPIGVVEDRMYNIEKVVIKKPWVKYIENKKIILYFGYIIKRKGLEYLIEAFKEIEKKYPYYVLVLAGGELDYQKEYAKQLREQVKKLNLEHKIIFTSFITEEEISKLFYLCDFVVLPYIYSISSSLPISFAIQYEKPVIATDIGTLHEEIKNGENGLLCKAKDFVSLSKAIEKLIKDIKFREFVSNGMKKNHEERRWSNVALQTFKLYSNIVSRNYVDK